MPTPIAGYRALFAKDPVTGEVFQIASTSSVVAIDDLSDVDTGTTGPTGGQVLVWDETLAQWVPGFQANTLDDLTDVTIYATGSTGPTGPTDGSVLIWDETLQQWVPGDAAIVGAIDDLTDVDTTTTSPVDKDALVWSATGGQWVPGARSIDDLSDVSTSATGPTGPSGPTQGQVLLWDETQRLWVPGAQANAIDDLTDVDTSTTGPTGGQVLLWDETLQQWVPGSQANAIDDLSDVDTSTTGPVDKDALVWSASGNQWVPGARSIDDLWDVNTVVAGATGPTGPAHGQMLAWDGTLNQWVPGPGASEVEIGPTLPTGPDWELWVDESPIAPPGGSTGPAPEPSLLLTGGEMTGDITFADEGEGVFVNGGGGILKKTGGGVVLRKAAGDAKIQVENNDGAGGDDIVTANGSQNVRLNTIHMGQTLADKIIFYDGGGMTAAINSGFEGITNTVYTGGSFMWTVAGVEVARIDATGISLAGVQDAPGDIGLADIRGGEPWQVGSVIAALIAKVEKLSAKVAELESR